MFPKKDKSPTILATPYTVSQCIALLEAMPKAFPKLGLATKVTTSRGISQFKISTTTKNLVGTIVVRFIGYFDPETDLSTRVITTKTQLGRAGYLPVYLTAVGIPILTLAAVMFFKLWVLWGIPILLAIALLANLSTSYMKRRLLEVMQETFR